MTDLATLDGRLVIDYLGGYCLVHGHGTVDGVPFFFRACRDGWRMAIDADPRQVCLGFIPGWFHGCDCDEGSLPAGWMPLDTAAGLIRLCAAKYLRERGVKL